MPSRPCKDYRSSVFLYSLACEEILQNYEIKGKKYYFNVKKRKKFLFWLKNIRTEWFDNVF